MRRTPFLLALFPVIAAISTGCAPSTPAVETSAPSPSPIPPPTSTSTATPTSAPTPTPTSTPIPTNVAPEIEIGEFPQELYAGYEIAIPVQIFDWDGDQFEVEVEQQLGMGDRYSGTEYVTSQVLKSLELLDGMLRVLSEFPGNYRIHIMATDKDGTSRESIDIPMTWAPDENPFQIRGIAIDTWGPPSWNRLNSVPQLIELMADIGANYFEISPYWHSQIIGGSEIESCTSSSAPGMCTTPSDERIREWIRKAHSLGLKVLLKPHLTGGSFHSDESRYDFESWQISPSNPREWFQNYSTFILHYAEIAQEEGVEIFSIGNELTYTQHMISRWREVIASIRGVYDGPLTYSDVLLWQSWEGQAWFWDDLDFIGVPYYFNGSARDPAPTIEEMCSHIERVQHTNLARAMAAFDKPLLATEIGRPNFDGTNYHPWDWSNIQDNQEVVDYIEAAFITMIGLGPRFNGLFVWKLWPRSETYPVDWDFRDKPLEDALRIWFAD